MYRRDLWTLGEGEDGVGSWWAQGAGNTGSPAWHSVMKGRMGDGREAQEGEHICPVMAESHCGTAETTQHCKSIIQLLKKLKEVEKDRINEYTLISGFNKWVDDGGWMVTIQATCLRADKERSQESWQMTSNKHKPMNICRVSLFTWSHRPLTQLMTASFKHIPVSDS